MFTATNSAVGATIYINNYQNGIIPGSHGQMLKLEQLKCLEAGACNGLTIIAGADVDLTSTSIDCQPDACTGCEIQAINTAPVPCDYQTQSIPQQPITTMRAPTQPVIPWNPFTGNGGQGNMGSNPFAPTVNNNNPVIPQVNNNPFAPQANNPFAPIQCQL